MTIKNEKEYREYCSKLDEIIAKGTKLGDMDKLSDNDKKEYQRISNIIGEYEDVCYPLPGTVSTAISDAITQKMEEKNLDKKQAARILGISVPKINALLHGKGTLRINLVKKLRDNFGIPADFVLDHM